MKYLVSFLILVSTVTVADEFDHPMFNDQKQSHRELITLLKNTKVIESQNKIASPPSSVASATSTVTPVVAKSLSERAQELPHNTISDPNVKKKVEDAIARGDAIIMHSTAR